MALEHPLLLKEKRGLSIKARQCADGGKNREGLNKRDTTSPTVSLEAILIISCISTPKDCDFMVVDIPGLFLTADMDEIVHMVLRVRLVELMVQLNQSIYRKYVRVENV